MQDNGMDCNHFRLQKSYDSIYENEAGIRNLDLKRWPRNRWDGLIHSCPTHANNVLEIGCGNGIVLYHLVDRCDRLTGVEISINRCEAARKNLSKLNKPIEILHANIEEGIDQPDSSYDLILWADVIEHVIDVFAAMRELSRLLMKGGTLITSTPNFAYLRYRLALLSGRFPGTSSKDQGFSNRPDEMYDGGHLHYFTFDVLKRLYQMHGISPVGILGYGNLGRIHNIWPSLLSGTAQVIGIKK